LRLYQHRAEPVVAAYDRFCRKLARSGLTRAPHEGPIDFLERIRRERPATATDAAPVFEAYVRLRYAGEGGREQVAAFRSLVRRFRTAG